MNKTELNTAIYAYGAAREALGLSGQRYGTERREMLINAAEAAKRKLDEAIVEATKNAYERGPLTLEELQ